MNWKEIVKKCQEEFEKENESMIIKLTIDDNISTNYDLKDGTIKLVLSGRADGLIYLKDLPYVPIGLFRVNIKFFSPTINDVKEARDDRTQILLHMYNLATAYIWRCSSDNMEVFERSVVHRDDKRMNEIFHSMCTMKQCIWQYLKWTVCEYLEKKYLSESEAITSSE